MNRHVSSCQTAARFLRCWPLSRGGAASGTGAKSYFNQTERLDPRNVNLLGQHAQLYIELRRFPEALRKFDQVLDIMPGDVDTLAAKAAIAQAEGDLPRASALLAFIHPPAEDPQALETQMYQAILERRPVQIIPRLKEILAKPDPALGSITGELRFYLGWAQDVAGDHTAAQESWRQARSELEPFLKEQPENFSLMGDLALTSMGLGDKAAAFKLIERAMAVIPIEKDAVWVLFRSRFWPGCRRAWGSPTAPSPRYRNCSRYRTMAHGSKRAAYSCAASARSDVRSAPERSPLPKAGHQARRNHHGFRKQKEIASNRVHVPVLSLPPPRSAIVESLFLLRLSRGTREKQP